MQETDILRDRAKAKAGDGADNARVRYKTRTSKPVDIIEHNFFDGRPETFTNLPTFPDHADTYFKVKAEGDSAQIDVYMPVGTDSEPVEKEIKKAAFKIFSVRFWYYKK